MVNNRRPQMTLDAIIFWTIASTLMLATLGSAVCSVIGG